ncbi:MAG TPA: hypothetical protein VMF11_08935 [Candidatus Baltobacteraceae bacterium]|nr:hypothetical protein [Candidatus Baltobacteraceae bacterium]
MIRWVLCGALLAAFLFATTAAALPDDACWQLLYSAIQHNAAAPHAAYISYAESVNLNNDGARYERANANITYRDDGTASIDDDRWVHPFMSTRLEPGPPVLGPYGSRRGDWLSEATGPLALPTIADVHNQPYRLCEIRGNETVNGISAVHIVIPDAPLDRPALKEIWIDPRSHAIARVIVAEFLSIYTESWNLEHPLVDFAIDVENIEGYTVLRRVTWSYSFRVYSQRSTLDAEYDFSNYRFDSVPPSGTLFATR